MPNQSSLRAMTQIRKGVTTPRKQGNRPPVESVCSPLLLYFFLSSSFFFFFFFLSFLLLLFFSLFFFFFLFFFSLLFSFSFSFFFPCFLFSIANGDPLFESRILIYIYMCMCVYAHGRWKPGRCPCEAGYHNLAGERSTCNLLYSIFRPTFLPTIRVFKCVFRAVR